MEVLIVTLFASVMLVASALVFFAWTLRQRSHEHIDRLTLLPLGDDAPADPEDKGTKTPCN